MRALCYDRWVHDRPTGGYLRGSGRICKRDPGRHGVRIRGTVVQNVKLGGGSVVGLPKEGSHSGGAEPYGGNDSRKHGGRHLEGGRGVQRVDWEASFRRGETSRKG